MAVAALMRTRPAQRLWPVVRRSAANARATVAALAVFGLVLGIGIGNGGFANRDVWRVGTLAVLALAAAALVASDRVELGWMHWTVLAAAAALIAWTALSALWSPLPTSSVLEAERTLLYGAALLAVAVGVGRPAVPYLLAGTAAGLTGVVLYGLVPYLVSPPPLNPVQGKLLFQPLGYANGMGICAAMGVILWLGFALTARPWRIRALALVPVAVLLYALYLTSSRGASAALLAGIVAMVVFAGYVRSPPLVLALLAAAVAAGVVAGSQSGERFSLLGQNRPLYWHAAWHDYLAHPFAGSGAGTFGRYWLYHHPSTTGELVQDAHNLYLELLAELGPLGLAFLVVLLATPLLALRSRGQPLVAAAGGAYVAFLVHAGVDWDWELPVVTLGGLACGAAVVAATSRRGATLPARARVALLVLIVAAAVLAMVRLAVNG